MSDISKKQRIVDTSPERIEKADMSLDAAADEYVSKLVPKFCPELDGDGVVNPGWLYFREHFLAGVRWQSQRTEEAHRTLRDGVIRVFPDYVQSAKCREGNHDWEPDTSMTHMRCNNCGVPSFVDQALAQLKKIGEGEK